FLASGFSCAITGTAKAAVRIIINAFLHLLIVSLLSKSPLLRSLLADLLIIIIGEFLVLLDNLLIHALHNGLALALRQAAPLAGFFHDFPGQIGIVVAGPADALGLGGVLAAIGIGLALLLTLIVGLCPRVRFGLLALPW